MLREVVAGSPNAEIADRLFISETTVKTHVNHILASWAFATVSRQSCSRTTTVWSSLALAEPAA